MDKLKGIQEEMLKAVNAFREENSLPPLALNEELNIAAHWQAVDMADNGYMSHTDSQSRNLRDRIAAECNYNGGCGENVAVGYADVAAVVKGWKGSPGHRANMLNKDYKELGVGYKHKTFQEEKADADTFDYMDYWCQVFGTGAK